MPASQWHHNKGSNEKSIILLILYAIEYSICICKIHFLKFMFSSTCHVNTAKISALLHSCVLTKWTKFGTEIFRHFWDTTIFASGVFLAHTVHCVHRISLTSSSQYSIVAILCSASNYPQIVCSPSQSCLASKLMYPTLADVS